MNFVTPIDASGSGIKVEESSILNVGNRLLREGTTVSNSISRMSRNQTMLPIAQSLNFTTPLSLSNTTTTGGAIHPVQMYQSGSFDDTIIDQQTSSGQTFLLASPGTVLSSNHMLSQGQVFIQGDELVGVSLPTSNAYSVNTNDTLYNAGSILHSGNQNISNPHTRIVVQPSTVINVSNSVSQANNGQYALQVKNNLLPNLSQNSNILLNNKGHIVIRSRGTKEKLKEEPKDLADCAKEDVYRVVIPKGTIKLPKVPYPVVQFNENKVLEKNPVKIIITNSACKPANSEEKPPPTTGRRLYECTNCNNKFMKALYLRMHMRSCKKPELKPEKTPLYMCSFCKSTFRTKAQITDHFSKCSQNPANIKDTSDKNIAEEIATPPTKKSKLTSVVVSDPDLEQAILYKCQDCDRTFSKERQYTSHIKRCTKVSLHDLSGGKAEHTMDSMQEDDHDTIEDPFADPIPVPQPGSRRGRGGGGRRGRPPGRISNAAQKFIPKNNVLFDGEQVVPSSSGLIVADIENMVRSTTGLAHTVQMSLEAAAQEGKPQPNALISDSKGVRGREKPPQAWSLVCSLCQKMFLTKSALATHVIDKHGPDLRETRNILLSGNPQSSFYRCPMCDLHYQSQQYFTEHLVLQHTTKLQECHRNLQAQTASYVCSMCSLVLLTKNLLLEHLSLEHLDNLEKLKLATIARNKKIHVENTAVNKSVNEDESIISNSLECRFCGEEFNSQDSMISHYVSVHNIETDEDGFILDLGVDVDIRVKDTKKLIQLADGRAEESTLPPKTILIRKKPKQSWQCQNCMQVFTRQSFWLRHIRDACPSEKNQCIQKESKFFCQNLECSHISFYQFKSLLKHREDVHHEEVKKDRQIFKNLSSFYDWFIQEERANDVRFVRDTTRIEKNNIRLLQFVCHRFHVAKSEIDVTKPTKKRWFVKIQRENNCHARILLRIEMNEITKQFDGKTQMLYYLDHFHNEIEDTPENLEQRFPIGRQLIKGSSESQTVDEGQQTIQSLSAPSTAGSVYLLSEESQIILPSPPTNGLYNSLAVNPKPMDDAFMVDEEYVLPADEAEWIKLFDVLESRLGSGEIIDQDQEEAQGLLQYKNVITRVNLNDQVAIFHKMCTLTNTSLEST